MDDSNLMKRFKGGEQSQRDLAGLLRWQGTALDAPRQRFPFNELHHQVEAVLLFSNVVDPARIRMSHLGCGARLLPEPAAAGRIPFEFANHLQGDDALQALV